MPSRRHTLTLVLVALAALLLGNLFPVSGVLGQGGQPPRVTPDIPAGLPPSASSVASFGAAAAPDATTAALGTVFTYQGNLKKNGQPISATCSFQFSLWDALSSGTQKDTTQAIGNTQVQGGAFTVQLDFGNQFTGEARWLQTAVKCPGDAAYITLTPRQSLNAVPYALSLVPGANVVQDLDNSTAIYGKGTGAGSVGLYGESPNFAGVYGKGYNGIVGVSSVSGAVATYGEHQGTNGYGVYGRAPDGYGTTGESTNSVGVHGKSVNYYGVYGESTDSLGVYGKSVESTGVYGESETTVGVYGKGTAGEGVYGYSDNANGVVGESDKAEGVRGASHNAGHAGVVGYNDGGSYGVYGESTLSSGVVGVSNAQNSGGVYGEGKGNGGYGVFGEAKGNGGYGVFGKAANGSGVVGVSTNWAGVYGETATAGVPGVWAKNTAGGIAFKAEGNAVQSANKGGFVKAMVFVNSAGQIVRCYNGVTGASSANCGFTASQDVPGGYSSFVIDFGFEVVNRFVSMTQVQPYGDDDYWEHWVYVKNLSGNTVVVESGYRQTAACRGEWRGDSGPFCTVGAASFMIFVY